MDQRFAPPGKSVRPKHRGWIRQHRAAMRELADRERRQAAKADKKLAAYLDRTGRQVDAMMEGISG